jgi:hypothetical protein
MPCAEKVTDLVNGGGACQHFAMRDVNHGGGDEFPHPGMLRLYVAAIPTRVGQCTDHTPAEALPADGPGRNTQQFTMIPCEVNGPPAADQVVCRKLIAQQFGHRLQCIRWQGPFRVMIQQEVMQRPVALLDFHAVGIFADEEHKITTHETLRAVFQRDMQPGMRGAIRRGHDSQQGCDLAHIQGGDDWRIEGWFHTNIDRAAPGDGVGAVTNDFTINHAHGLANFW